jgi:hypothetical protein
MLFPASFQPCAKTREKEFLDHGIIYDRSQLGLSALVEKAIRKAQGTTPFRRRKISNTGSASDLATC